MIYKQVYNKNFTVCKMDLDSMVHRATCLLWIH